MCIVGERCLAGFSTGNVRTCFTATKKRCEGRPGDKAIFNGLRERRFLPNYLTVLLNAVCFITTVLAVEKPNRDNVVEGSYQLSEDTQGKSIRDLHLNFFSIAQCVHIVSL